MPLTADGYPYPTKGAPDNNWNWIKNPGSWKTNRAANDFLAEMGERAMPGWQGFAGKYLGKGFKWIASVIGALIAAIPIPGMQVLGATIIATAQTLAKEAVEDAVKKALEDAAKELGVLEYIGNVKQILYVPIEDHQALMTRWGALSGHAQSIVIHYIVNRWDWGYHEIMSLDFGTTEGKKHFTTLLIAVLCFSEFQFNKNNGWSGRNREFMAGEGVGFSLCHYGDPPRWNPESQKDIDRMRQVCLLASTIEITYDEKEAEEFLKKQGDPSELEKGKLPIAEIIGGISAAKYLKLF